MKEKLAVKLNEAVLQQEYNLNTGFLSTVYLLEQLTENGYADTEFRLL